MRIEHYAGVLGLFAAAYGIWSAIFEANVFWYSYFVIGGTLFLAYVNYAMGNENLFEKCRKMPVRFAKLYAVFVCVGIASEAAGRMVLHLWYLHPFSLAEEILHVYAVGYPFALFLAYESFTIIRKHVKSLYASVIVATLSNAFVHEIPNTFAWAWTYTIPFVDIEIAKVNIIVIIGWSILVIIPAIANRIVLGKGRH